MDYRKRAPTVLQVPHGSGVGVQSPIQVPISGDSIISLVNLSTTVNLTLCNDDTFSTTWPLPAGSVQPEPGIDNLWIQNSSGTDAEVLVLTYDARFPGVVPAPSSILPPTPPVTGPIPILPVIVVSVLSGEVTTHPPSHGATIDGYSVPSGKRVLLTKQSAHAQDNGIWVVNTGGLWTRPTDWANGSPIPDGQLVTVSLNEGSWLWGTVWISSPNEPPGVIGTNQVFFDLIAGVPLFKGQQESPGKPQTLMNGLLFPQQATTVAEPAWFPGAMYYNTTLNKLRIGGASGWETVTSV